MIGGSSVERVANVRSVDAHVKPANTFPSSPRACRERVSPTTMLTTFGLMFTDGDVPRLGGTLKLRALLQIPFCWIRTIPLTALPSTVATTCVSAQDTTSPGVLPTQTMPLPWTEPKPLPVMVTLVPETPLVGVMLSMDGVLTANGTALLTTPPGVSALFQWPSPQLRSLKFECHSSWLPRPAPFPTRFVQYLALFQTLFRLS
jgi:hypothetical protein